MKKQIALLLVLAVLVAGCGPTPEPQIIKETVEVEKEVTVVETVEVEKEVTVVETVEVEKEVTVVETVEVEKEGMSEIQELRVVPSAWESVDMANADPARFGNMGFFTLLWAPLVAGDSAGNPIPEKSLAESFDVSTDGAVYTFHLRSEAKFSDGSPITAQDVVDNVGYWAMLMHPEASGYRSAYGIGQLFLHDVVGFLDAAKDAEYDEFGFLPVPGVRAVDEDTVEFTLEGPSGDFILRMTYGMLIFKPDDVRAAKGKEFAHLDYWPSYAAHSGPYTIGEVNLGQSFTMVPNEYYFGPKPTISKITLTWIEDPNTRLTAFANKEIDVITKPFIGDQVREALADPYLASCLVRPGGSNMITQFWVTPTKPMDDVHVRRAFSMAIDRSKLIDIINAGSEVPLWVPVNMHTSPEIPSCQEEVATVTMLPYDPAQAKAELEQSKYWPDVLDIEIHIWAQTTEHLPESEATAAMLKENLGFKKVTVHTESIADLMNPPFPLHLWRNHQSPFVPSLPVLLQNMAGLVPDEPFDPEQNLSFIAAAYIPELKELVRNALKAPDEATKCALSAQAGQMWNDQVFSIDLAAPIEYFLIAPWVKDLEFKLDASRGAPMDIEKAWVAKH